MSAVKGTFGVMLGLALVVLLAVGGYTGYWWLAKDTTNKRYETNVNNQQFQAGMISQARNYVQGFYAATDPAQKGQIKASFCSVYLNLNNPIPNDLQLANSQICQ